MTDHPKIIELLARQHEQGRILVSDLMNAGAPWGTIAQVAATLQSLDEATHTLGDRRPMQEIEPYTEEYAPQMAGQMRGYSSELLNLEATMRELTRLEKRFFEALEELGAKVARLEPRPTSVEPHSEG